MLTVALMQDADLFSCLSRNDHLEKSRQDTPGPFLLHPFLMQARFRHAGSELAIDIAADETIISSGDNASLRKMAGGFLSESFAQAATSSDLTLFDKYFRQLTRG